MNGVWIGRKYENLSVLSSENRYQGVFCGKKFITISYGSYVEILNKKLLAFYVENNSV